MSKVTAISSQSLGSFTDTYTVTEDGVYDITIKANHLADQCPSGTGRYSHTFYLNGDTIHSHYGPASDFTYKKVMYLHSGDFFSTSAIYTWCSNCNYSNYSNATISILKWNFEIN